MNESFKIKRLKKVQDLLEKEKLSAFLFSSYPNVFYLSNFRSSNAYILISKKGNYFFTDARYYERAKTVLSKLFEVHLIVGDPFKFLKNFLKSKGLKKIGIEKDRVSIEFKERLRSRDYQLIGFSQPLKYLRMIKTEEELLKIKKAVTITDEIYKELLGYFSLELTEMEIRGKIIELAFKKGAEGEAFPSIIASSAHSAIPHWESSKEKLSPGALLIDMGVIFEGYCSDFTRTLVLGKVDREFKKYFEIVKSAWFKGFEKVKTGTPVYEIDKAIREYLESKGVLQYFIHATGHGLGIEIHEFPRLFYQKSSKYLKEQPIIEEGMVFTIEPGLYFPGKFGIRLENVVFVEGGEGKIYSTIPLDLIRLP